VLIISEDDSGIMYTVTVGQWVYDDSGMTVGDVVGNFLIMWGNVCVCFPKKFLTVKYKWTVNLPYRLKKVYLLYWDFIGKFTC
jgi:hypothetical protein